MFGNEQWQEDLIDIHRMFVNRVQKSAVDTFKFLLPGFIRDEECMNCPQCRAVGLTLDAIMAFDNSETWKNRGQVLMTLAAHYGCTERFKTEGMLTELKEVQKSWPS